MNGRLLRSLAAAVFVIGVANTAGAVPAQAGPPAPLAPVDVTAVGLAAGGVAAGRDCDTARQLVAKQASGRYGLLNCVRSGASTSAATAAATASSTASSTCGNGTWVYTRRTTCNAGLGTLLIVQRPSGTVVGAINYTVTMLVSVHGRSDRWNHTYSIRSTSAWGAVSGTTVTALGTCGQSCTLISSTSVGGSALPTNSHGGSATFSTPYHGIGSIWTASSAWTWHFTSPITTPANSNPTTWTAPAHRCDDTLGLSFLPGCTYPSVRPIHEIPTAAFPKYARHVQLAINFGLPSVLTRSLNGALNVLNRAKACPSGPNYPRPEGFSCDEYPFSSTYDGAASHSYGRTFLILYWQTGNPPFVCNVPWLAPRRAGDSGGYSVCMVPIAENSGGGTNLGLFYYDNRVIDHDTFQVRVV